MAMPNATQKKREKGKTMDEILVTAENQTSTACASHSGSVKKQTSCVDYEENYPVFLESVRARVNECAGGPAFVTPTNGMFNAFLAALPDEIRQHYNCHACRAFITKYGGLVAISKTGETASAVWDVSATPEPFRQGVSDMVSRATKSRTSDIVGVFLTHHDTLGTPITGEWSHLSAPTPSAWRAGSGTATTQRFVAEKAHERETLRHAVCRYSVGVVNEAIRILSSGHLSRGTETWLAMATWLYDLCVSLALTQNKRHRKNMVWLAAASAPSGFCHVSNTMLGTLMDDIIWGLPFDKIKRRFETKTSPLQYQRPQVAPTAGNIVEAERIIEELGLRGSLARRYATLDEVVALWRNSKNLQGSRDGDTSTKALRVFSGVIPKRNTRDETHKLRHVDLPPIIISCTQFVEHVVPTAEHIEFVVLGDCCYNFGALVTAVNPDAPPIIRWDTVLCRNPFSWYVYARQSKISDWGLVSGPNCVTAICAAPRLWHEEDTPALADNGVFFLIHGAKDTRYKTAGLGLFPQILRAELRYVRATIEAFSKQGEIHGAEDASACGLLLTREMLNSVPFNQKHRFRVFSAEGFQDYVVDRWD